MALSKPFAVNGNKTPIALEKTDDGVMNYEEGFGARYEQPIKAVIDEAGNITSTGGLQITRPQFNALINDLSVAIIENQEKSARNFERITDLANVVSGCAFLVRNNKFTGNNSFSNTTIFSGTTTFNGATQFNAESSFDNLNANTATFAINPELENPLSYSAMANDSLTTKANLELQVENLKKIISAQASELRKIISGITANITISSANARFNTIYCKNIVVSSGATILSGAVTSGSATTQIFTDSGLHLVKFYDKE